MELSGVFLTNQKAADGTKFTTENLLGIVYQGSSEATPTHLSHNFDRLIGWSHTTGLYIAPDVDCVLGRTIIPESETEFKRLIEYRKVWLENQTSEPFNRFGIKFLEFLSDKGVIDSKTNITVHYNSILMVGYDNIVFKAFPKLKDCKDRYGIFPLEEILKSFKYIGGGVFKENRSDLCIMVHPYLRKALSRHNNFNLQFLEAFLDYRSNKKVRLKIGIDLDYLGYAPSFALPKEFEYIYGAPFDDDVSKIKLGDAKFENKEQDHLYYHSLQTEYNWKIENNEFTFEMEDVNDYAIPSLEGNYGCYYVHSQYDFKTGAFKHFDGAIRAYDEEMMIDRLDKRMVESGKNAIKTKLFCMDGEIPIQTWKKMITLFTYGTPSVYEYFNLERPTPSIPTSETKPLIYQFIPYKLDEGDGIRLFVSFRNRLITNETPRWFSSCDQIKKDGNDKKTECIESIVTDVAAYFIDNDAPIEIPKDSVLIDSNDVYFNLPILSHGIKNTQVNLSKTWNAIKGYIAEKAENAPLATFAISLAWNLSEKEITLSFAGNVIDMEKWLNQAQYIPAEMTRLRKWIEQQSKYIHKQWSGAVSYERDAIVNSDGILFFKRRNIIEDSDRVTIEFIGNEPKYVIKDSSLNEIFQEQQIAFSYVGNREDPYFFYWSDNRNRK